MSIFLSDFFSFLTACIQFSFLEARGMFLAVSLLGIVVGAGGWWLCSYVAQLWNTSYKIHFLHHFLCGLSALLVFLAVGMGYCLSEAKTVAGMMIDRWGDYLGSDPDWGHETFCLAYDAVKAQGGENFAGYPEPRAGGNRIPCNLPASQEACAEVYVENAGEDFYRKHPVLGTILSVRDEVSKDVVVADVQSFFGANPGGTYPIGNAIRITANHVKAGLEVQTPKVVLWSRIILFGLFLVVFGGVLALVSIGAYQDIKVYRKK